MKNIHTKWYNAAVLLASLIGYLEWGEGNSVFLIRAEAELLSKLFTDPVSALHPFTILPLLGQVLLLSTLFRKDNATAVSYTGIALLAVLLLFMLFVGILSVNFRIIASVLPFLILSVLCIRQHRLRKKELKHSSVN